MPADITLSTRNDIAYYYEDCEIDYRLAWDLDHSRAMHIGYWDWSTWTLRAALARQNAVMADFGHVARGDRVLDAGCGIGGSALYLAKNFDCQVTGISVSQRQVERARANARHDGLEDRVSFVVGDYCNTSFAPESFDVVWALESLCYAPDKRAFAREAFRLLKPGGWLVVADGFTTRERYSSTQRETLNRWYHAWAIDHLVTTAKMTEVLDGIGFGSICFADLRRAVEPSSQILFAKAVVALPVGRLLQALGWRTERQQLNLAGAIFQRQVWQQNLARYFMFCARKPRRLRRRSRPARAHGETRAPRRFHTHG